MPSPTDNEHFTQAARSMIYESYLTYCKGIGMKNPPKFDFPMPTIHQLSVSKRHKVTTLPTYSYNEGKISDTIKFLQKSGEQIGLTAEASERIVLPHWGDFATVRNQ